MRFTTSMYALITAVFHAIRITMGTSKPLLVDAILHNLCEWLIVIQISTKPQTNLRKISIGVACVWTLIEGLVIIFTPLETGGLLAQLAGILLDFLLPLLFFQLTFLSNDKNVRNFYILPFFAHFIHLFFTILPLLWNTFILGEEPPFLLVNEIMIYLSGPVTYILYALWSKKFEKLANDEHGFPETYLATNFVIIGIILSFAMGMIAVLGVPSHTPGCSTPSTLLEMVSKHYHTTNSILQPNL